MQVVNIINTKCRKQDYDGIILHEGDFHPCHPFFIDHPNIKPETVDKIYIKGILEQHKYLRCVLRYCDYMLKPEGILEIDFYNAHFDSPGYAVRGQNEWRYELSLVLGDRIRLVKQDKGLNSNFVFKKTAMCFPKDDSITKWSFGIVSDGRKNERIMSLINTISSFKIPEFEILICGPSPADALPPNVKVIDDSPCYVDLRIPISRKKNLLIKAARFNNLIIMHDRISFPSDWYKKMCIYGNYYDLLCVPILNEDDHSKRMIDWVTYGSTSFEFNKLKLFSRGNSYLNYDEWSEKIYVNGGYFQVKRNIISSVMLNPNLYWGEKEDTDMSIRLYDAGVLVSLFNGNCIYSQGSRFNGTDNTHYNIIYRIRCFLGAVRRYFREQKAFITYLNK